MKKNILVTLVALLLTSYASAEPQSLSGEELKERKQQILEAFNNLGVASCKEIGGDGDESYYAHRMVSAGIRNAHTISIDKTGQPLLQLSSTHMHLQITTSADFYSIVAVRAQSYKPVNNLATGETVMVPDTRIECAVKQ